MTVPVFEEYEPAADCGCAGCAQQRRILAAGGHPNAHGLRRVLAVLATAGVVLGSGGAGVADAVGPAAAGTARPGEAVDAQATADPVPVTEQGRSGPLHGPSGKAATAAAPLRKTTRAEIINRAKKWVSAGVPYSMELYWTDGYRQDCSGYVSMAWGLAGNEWTGSLAEYATPITREELQPGDILLFHNPDNPTRGSHVVLFGGWTDYTHTSYIAYEQVKPQTRRQATPMAYWTNSSKYLPYRYKGLTGAAVEAPSVATVPGTGAKPGTGANPGTGAKPGTGAYPGMAAFGPGANNKYVTRLAELLSTRGGKHFYPQGPEPRWDDMDRLATQAFQLSQGWQGAEADGMPGPGTWRLLVTKKGRNIIGAGASGPGGKSAVAPAFPGRGYFLPGRSSTYVTQLGRQLVKRGYGKHYTSGPGPAWGEVDRRNVEAFQQAQGWRGAAADGFPGPETWRRLFA
ncbi:peptidoglycan-binding protein [Streptomyces sp. NPDC048479]|uniref:peptidoglycan-binding protein n=1 Tax=Streptomyces sp. NPDC048479 TaxID=3154725 RepID=UPI00341DAB26